LFIDNDHVSCPGEEGFRPNDARFCEALASRTHSRNRARNGPR
jgi:hypothetical protein